MEKISKSTLIDQVMQDTGMRRQDVMNVINSTFDRLQHNLAEGNTITIVNFGTFEVRDRQARTGRVPGTGEAINIPARKFPAFKAGKELRKAVGA